MWLVDPNGKKEYQGGKDDWAGAARAAAACAGFRPDVEEELIAEDPRSCYNCRYRRWSVASFTCMT